MARDDEPAQPVGTELLATLFSSRVRAKVLVHVISHAESRFSLTELGSALGLAVSSVQHECYKLERLGILRGGREGSSRRYALQVEHPVVRALAGLVVAATGLPVVIEQALRDLPGLHAATLLGAVPPQPGETVLVLIGELALDSVALAQDRVSWLLDVEDNAIEVAVFRPAEWLAKREAGHPLVRRLLDLPVRLAFGDVRADTA